MILRDREDSIWYPDANGVTYSRINRHPGTPPEKWTFDSIDHVCGPVFPLQKFRDSNGDLWTETDNGRYAVEYSEPGYMEDWPFDAVDQCFGPLTIEKEEN